MPETPETGAMPTLFHFDTFALDIEWEKPGLPRLVGPFPTEAEAVEWGELNIPNGTWSVSPLAWPYARARGRRG